MPSLAPPAASVGPHWLPHDAQHHMRLVGVINSLHGERHMPGCITLNLPKTCPPGSQACLPMSHQLGADLKAAGNRQGEKIKIVMHDASSGCEVRSEFVAKPSA